MHQNQPTDSDAELSLADYRVSRESRAEGKPAESAEDKPASGAESAGETAAEDQGAAEEHTEPEAGEASEQKPARKGGFQRKIERQEREIEDLKRQLAGKDAGRTAADSEPRIPDHPGFAKPKPKLEEFDSVEAFTDAITDWKLEKKDFEREQTARQETQRAQAESLVAGWNERKAEAQKAHSDYDETLAEADDVELSPAHQHVLLESEHGPELAYKLAKDREALEKFAGMTPLAAARYLGSLEAELAAERKAPKPEASVSQAPKPVRPIAASRSSAASLDISKMSIAEYRKARESGRLR
jgi:hypothetical protein